MLLNWYSRELEAYYKRSIRVAPHREKLSSVLIANYQVNSVSNAIRRPWRRCWVCACGRAGGRAPRDRVRARRARTTRMAHAVPASCPLLPVTRPPAWCTGRPRPPARRARRPVNPLSRAAAANAAPPPRTLPILLSRVVKFANLINKHSFKTHFKKFL